MRYLPLSEQPLAGCFDLEPSELSVNSLLLLSLRVLLKTRSTATLFGSPAVSCRDLWALRPRLATGLPFSQQRPWEEEMRLLTLINVNK